jgi:hypothetical protein
MMVAALDQGHESRSLLEHLLEPRALPNRLGRLVQQLVPMLQRTRCQSRILLLSSSVLRCARVHSDFGMQTFLGIRDPVSTYLHTGLSASFCPVTVIGGWAGGGGACWATAALLAAAAMINRTIRKIFPPTTRPEHSPSARVAQAFSVGG